MRNALRSILILLLLTLPATLYATPTIVTPQLSPFTAIELTPSPYHKTAVPVVHKTVIPRRRVPVRMIDETQADVQCLAIAIYREARGESNAGMAGVGYVIMNRVANRHFPPKTICGVVKQSGIRKSTGKRSCQFSWVCHPPRGKINARSYARATRIAQQVIAGTIANPVGNAIYFHERRSSRGSPSRHAPYRIALGNHVFFGPTPARAVQLAAR